MDDPHAEVEIKPQLKPRGSVAKEVHLKPFYQLYKLQIKFTQSTRQTVSMEHIKGHRELPLVLVAVDIGGKNTQEDDQIRV